MTQKPKILMIAPLPPPIHGSAMMTKYIKDSDIINQNFKLDWVNLSTSRRMDEIGKNPIKKIGRFISSFFQTWLKLISNRYSACYLAITCHGIGFLKDFPFIMLCKLFGNKIIIHQHNKGMSVDADKKLYKPLLKYAYSKATVILLSWRLYPDIAKIVSRTQVKICPNGIPVANQYPKAENQVPRILFLSNLIESKGVITLLDACKILKDSNIDFQCDFIGGETSEIPKWRFIDEVIKRNLEKNVTYLGCRFGDEKYRHLANCDIFVFPTNYLNECFPLVILEAMQQKCAIVTTDVGGIPDIIRNDKSGIIVHVNDPSELAAKIKYLITNPLKRKELAETAFKDFYLKYTIYNFEQEIFAQIKSAIVQ